MENWDWPQYVVAAIYAVSVLANAYMHGEPKTGSYSAPGTIIGTALGVWILYMGGFWS